LGILIAWLGGVFGTVVMDLVMIGTFFILDWPLDTFLTVLATGVETDLSMIGLGMEVSLFLAIFLHYMTGSVVSIVFVIIVMKLDIFQTDMIKKFVALGVIGTEIICLTFFTPTILLLGYTASETIELLTMTCLFRGIFGLFFGLIVEYGFSRFVYSGV
jgi:hypothetical protein